MPSYNFRGIRHARTGYCLWCGNRPARKASTTEHLIPRWVLRAFHQFPSEDNTWTACYGCNQDRGPMPPALYASIRGNRAATTKATVYWHVMAQTALYERANEPSVAAMRAQVVSDFCAMIPEETGVRDPRIGTWPYKLVTLCKKAPTQAEWLEIALGYPFSQYERVRQQPAGHKTTIDDWNVGAYKVNPPHSKNPPLKRLDLTSPPQTLESEDDPSLR